VVVAVDEAGEDEGVGDLVDGYPARALARAFVAFFAGRLLAVFLVDLLTAFFVALLAGALLGRFFAAFLAGALLADFFVGCFVAIGSPEAATLSE